jgi:hypothetical protein
MRPLFAAKQLVCFHGVGSFFGPISQSPVPLGGNMISWDWFKRYNPNEPNGPTVDFPALLPVCRRPSSRN